VQYKEHDNETLPSGVVHGSTFSTVTIDTPAYLPYLASRLIGSGGTVLRGSVQHINEIVEGGARVFSAGGKQATPPDAIVVCTGLGTRTLGGVEDRDVYPIRGQTVLLKAPWIKFGRTMAEKDGTWTYVIPRRSGDVRRCFLFSPSIWPLIWPYVQVIVGGTKGVDDWQVILRSLDAKILIGNG
jgi:D-amino-acid oxidase